MQRMCSGLPIRACRSHRLFSSSSTRMVGAASSSASLFVSSRSSGSLKMGPFASSVVLLQGFGGGMRGRGNFGGGGRGGNMRGGPQEAGQRPMYPNTTRDGELSPETRAAMRDEAIITAAILKNIPPNGAISVKALNASLPEDIQEAVCEKHNGLSSFLRERQQLFIVKPRPEDQVLFVAGNPIAIQKYASREAQKRTMRSMMGLDDTGRRGGGGRGRSFGRGGGGGRNFGGGNGGARAYGSR